VEREETRGGDGKVVEEKERDEGKRREGEEWEGLDLTALAKIPAGAHNYFTLHAKTV